MQNRCILSCALSILLHRVSTVPPKSHSTITTEGLIMVSTKRCIGFLMGLGLSRCGTRSGSPLSCVGATSLPAATPGRRWLNALPPT